jgi:hypothetical protein
VGGLGARRHEAVFSTYDEEVVWDFSRAYGIVVISREYRGHDGVRRFFRDWAGLSKVAQHSPWWRKPRAWKTRELSVPEGSKSHGWPEAYCPGGGRSSEG